MRFPLFIPANLDGRFATPGLHIKGSLRAVLCLVRPLASAVSSFPAGPSRTHDGRQRHALSFSTRTDLRTVPIVPLLSGRMPAPGQPGQKTPPRNGHCHPSRASVPAGPSVFGPARSHKKKTGIRTSRSRSSYSHDQMLACRFQSDVHGRFEQGFGQCAPHHQTVDQEAGRAVDLQLFGIVQILGDYPGRPGPGRARRRGCGGR